MVSFGVIKIKNYMNYSVTPSHRAASALLEHNKVNQLLFQFNTFVSPASCHSVKLQYSICHFPKFMRDFYRAPSLRHILASHSHECDSSVLPSQGQSMCDAASALSLQRHRLRILASTHWRQCPCGDTLAPAHFHQHRYTNTLEPAFLQQRVCITALASAPCRQQLCCASRGKRVVSQNAFWVCQTQTSFSTARINVIVNIAKTDFKVNSEILPMELSLLVDSFLRKPINFKRKHLPKTF